MPADYQSRHPMQCDNQDCQICQFIIENENASVCAVSLSDVLDGKLSMPFTNHVTWKSVHQDFTALRITYAHLSQGTRPTKKNTWIKDVKRYLHDVTIGRDGLLVVKHTTPFTPTRDLIVVPRQI